MYCINDRNERKAIHKNVGWHL